MMNRFAHFQLLSTILLPALIVTLAGTVFDTFACSCMSERKPCEAFGRASAVFVGRVAGGAERYEEKDEYGNRVVFIGGEIRFAIEKSYHGVAGKEVVIHSGTGGGDCGMWFKLGETYLVYAYGNAKEGFGTSICSRTRPLSTASEDLAFLEHLPEKGSGIRLYGKVYSGFEPGEEDQEPRVKGVAGILVTAKSADGKTHQMKTDDAGAYEFTGLKAGKYTIAVKLPDYYEQEYTEREVTLADQGCAEESFAAVINGRISGRVVDSEGKPVIKGCVVALNANDEKRPGFFQVPGSDYLDEKGEFEISSLPPGRYLLGLNVNHYPDLETPYPPTWYPGVPEEVQALVVNLELGQQLNDITIKLPPKLTPRKVEGVVLWPNGRPASKASIRLEPDEYPGWCVNGCGNADEKGRFTLYGFEGMTYHIQASADVNPDAEPQNRRMQYAEPVTIEISKDIDGLKIILKIDEQTFNQKSGKKEE